MFSLHVEQINTSSYTRIIKRLITDLKITFSRQSNFAKFFSIFLPCEIKLLTLSCYPNYYVILIWYLNHWKVEITWVRIKFSKKKIPGETHDFEKFPIWLMFNLRKLVKFKTWVLIFSGFADKVKEWYTAPTWNPWFL